MDQIDLSKLHKREITESNDAASRSEVEITVPKISKPKITSEIIAENPLLKRKKIQKIQSYLNTFVNDKKYAGLIPIRKRNFESMSINELDDNMTEIEYILNYRRNDAIAVLGAKAISTSIEAICVEFTPLKVQGMTDAMFTENMQDDIRLLSLEYGTDFVLTPGKRIALHVAGTMYGMHKYNTERALGPEAASTVVNPIVAQSTQSYKSGITPLQGKVRPNEPLDDPANDNIAIDDVPIDKYADL